MKSEIKYPVNALDLMGRIVICDGVGERISRTQYDELCHHANQYDALRKQLEGLVESGENMNIWSLVEKWHIFRNQIAASRKLLAEQEGGG